MNNGRPIIFAAFDAISVTRDGPEPTWGETFLRFLKFDPTHHAKFYEMLQGKNNLDYIQFIYRDVER